MARATNVDSPVSLRLGELAFGSRSAEKESRFSPDMLRKSFLDIGDTTTLIRNGECFYVVGPKGAGKSAIIENLALEAEATNHDFYVEKHVVGDLPHTMLKKIVPGKEAEEVSYRRAWKYILYVLAYRSMASDPHATSDAALSRDDVNFLLSRIGLLEAESISDIVTKSKIKSVKAATQGLGGSRETLQEFENLNNDVLYETVRSHVLASHSSRRHFVSIDGLDRVFSSSPNFRQSVSALLGAVFDANMELLDNQVPTSIVVLVRRDMMEDLMTPDLSKFTGDHASHLDWYDARVEPHESALWRLIERRASIGIGAEIRVHRDFLPSHVNGDENTVKYLLDRTRHRPRDLIELMNNVAKATKRQRALANDVVAGFTRYAENYLLDEIEDELKGFLDREEINAAVDLLRAIKKKSFSYKQAEETIDGDLRFANVDLRKILVALFNCGALGMLDKRVAGKPQYRFKYRNRKEPFDPNLDCCVHKGLWSVLHL